MKKLIEKVLEYNGPVEVFKQSGLTNIYLSKELKENKEIEYPDNVAHTFFAPVTDDFIFEIEKEYNIVLPEIYKEFVKECNGFSLESGYLSFYGLPLGLWKGFSQKEKAFLSKDIFRENEYSAPKKISSRYLVIGKDYSNDNWIGIKENKVFLINKFGKQLEEIDFIKECIISVDEFNKESVEIISHIKDLYKK